MSAVSTEGESRIGDVRGPSERLRRELTQPEVFMQAIGAIAPGATLIFVVGLMVQTAGSMMITALVVGGLVCATLAWNASHLARLIPSAGGFYAWTAASLGARWAFVVGLSQLFIGFSVGLNAGYIGKVVEDQLNAAYGVRIPWFVTLIVIIGVTRLLVWRGVKLSGRALLILAVLELAMMLVLGLWGFADPGPGGGTLAVFDSGSIPAGGSFFLALTFAVFFFAGWEGAGPVAEESRNPRRAVPVAMIGSILILIVIYVVASLGMMAGWGADRLGTFGAGDEAPAFTLAQTFWGSGWIVLLVVLLNSVAAYAICGTLAITRIMYAMARAGVLPRGLAELSPRYGTPHRAVLTELVISIGIGLILGAWLEPDQAFFTYGLAATILLCFVYSVGNLAVSVHFLRTERAALRVVPHVVLPTVTTLVLAYVVYRSVSPFPDYPVGGGIWWALAWLAIATTVGVTVGRRALGRPIDSEGDRVNLG